MFRSYSEFTASGKKLKKTLSTGKVSNYEEDEIYENNQLYQTVHDEGRIVDGVFEYTITDHLGNARVSFKDNNGAPEITQENHTGAWGEALPSLSYQNTTKVSNFTYSTYESENDFGIGVFDAHARVFDPIVGKFWQNDVLSELFFDQSPTNFNLNSPFMFSDPSGNYSQRIFDMNGNEHYIEDEDIENVFKGGDDPKKVSNSRVLLFGGAMLSINGIDISDETKAISRGIDKSMASDVIMYNHPYFFQKDESFIIDIVSNVVDNYSKGQKLIFYGYSKGGELVQRIVRELDKKGIPIELLITVDAAESFASNSIDREIPKNVKLNYNVFQTDKEATFLESYGNYNFGTNKPINFNQTGMTFKGNKITHSNIDEANIVNVINWINNKLKK